MNCPYRIPAELKLTNLNVFYYNFYKKIRSLSINKTFKSELIEIFKNYSSALCRAYSLSEQHLERIHLNKDYIENIRKQKAESNEDIKSMYKKLSKNFRIIRCFHHDSVRNALQYTVSILVMKINVNKKLYNYKLKDIEENKKKNIVNGTVYAAISCVGGFSLTFFARLFSGSGAFTKSSCLSTLVVVVCYVTFVISLLTFLAINYYIPFQKNTVQKRLNDLRKFFDDVNMLNTSSQNLIEQISNIEVKKETFLDKFHHVHNDFFVDGTPIDNRNGFLEAFETLNDDLYENNLNILKFLNE
jgi:hypothetical protein